MSDATDPSYCGYTTYDQGPSTEDLPNTGADATGHERAVWERLRAVEDPEMPVSVVDLGLIYDVVVSDRDGQTEASVQMTLTYTGCPAREMLQKEVRAAAATAAGIDEAHVNLVWSPPWNLSMVTDAGEEQLREFGVSI